MSCRSAGSGCYLCRWAAGAEHGVAMFDEDVGEDVDGRQRGQRDGTVARPDQVHPEHTGQVGRTHLVDEALPRHLKATDRRFNEFMSNKHVDKEYSSNSDVQNKEGNN